MDVLVELLFWIHLVALALGGVAVFGIPFVGRRMGASPPEQRPALMALIEQMSKVGRAAFGVLIVTGPLILWLRYGWAPPNATWFGLKMLFVLILLGVMIYAGINNKRAAAGDVAAARRAPMIGMAGIVTYALLILCAVFAFG
jgi:uncharacterized membrane protein